MMTIQSRYAAIPGAATHSAAGPDTGLCPPLPGKTT